MQAHERGAQQFSLKRVAGTDCFGDDRAVGNDFLLAGRLVPFGVEQFIRLGDIRREAEPPHGVATGVLKVRYGFDEPLVAGADGAGVQREDMIKDAHEILQPFALRAVQLFDRSVDFSLSFIFCMNSENRRTSSVILSAMSLAMAAVLPDSVWTVSWMMAQWFVAELICSESFSSCWIFSATAPRALTSSAFAIAR